MKNLNAAREFGLLARSEFSFLEADDGPNPDFNIMATYYEGIYSKSYPWLRTVGYWNVFVDLNIVWDPFDQLFAIWIQASHKRHVSDLSDSPVLHADWVLDVLRPNWRQGWPNIDASDGTALLKLYASAIRPCAREMFLPSTRPSHGLEGFSWWSQAKLRADQRTGTP